MRFQIEGLNIHHKISFKKPLGSKSSFLNNVVQHPGYAALAPLTGGASLLGNAASLAKNSAQNSGANNNPGGDPGANDQAMIEAKYAELAKNYGDAAVPLRSKLAASLANNTSNTFQQENPFILEDLNSRGLSSSPTAVANSQTQELGRLATANTEELNNFDTDVFNQEQNLNATGTGTGLQRLFDMHDQASQTALAQSLARRKSRDSLYGAGIGALGKIGSSALGFL